MRILSFIVLNKVGQILRYGTTSEDLIETVARPGDGETFITELSSPDIIGARDFSQLYWDFNLKALVPRQNMPITLSSTTVPADGVSVIDVTGLPSGALITFNNNTTTTPDSSLHIVFDLPGDYPLKITQWPFNTYEVTLHAT